MTTPIAQPDCTVITNTDRRVLQVDPKDHGRVVIAAMDKSNNSLYKLSIGYDELEALAHTLLMYKSQPGRQQAYEAMLEERKFKADQAAENEFWEDQTRYGTGDYGL